MTERISPGVTVHEYTISYSCYPGTSEWFHCLIAPKVPHLDRATIENIKDVIDEWQLNDFMFRRKLDHVSAEEAAQDVKEYKEYLVKKRAEMNKFIKDD